MSDNLTRENPDARSFEERVFARFDALDARFTSLERKVDQLDARLTSLEGKVDALDGRLITLEDKVDARLRETRPIWEAVQSRLTNIESSLDNIESEIKTVRRQIHAMHRDTLNTRADQEELRERIEKLESEPTRG